MRDAFSFSLSLTAIFALRSALRSNDLLVTHLLLDVDTSSLIPSGGGSFRNGKIYSRPHPHHQFFKKKLLFSLDKRKVCVKTAVMALPHEAAPEGCCQACYEKVVLSSIHVCSSACRGVVHSGGGTYSDTAEFRASCVAESLAKHERSCVKAGCS